MPKVYFSPSQQGTNPCAEGDSERAHCALVADLVEKYFTASGIEYKRNRTLTKLADIAADSNAYAPDLHLALHTNGSNGTVRGHHVYYYPTSPDGKRMAQILCDRHKEIYSAGGAQNQAIGNNAYTELKKTRAVAVIEETVFHDNPEDAAWYHDHLNEVARYVAASVCAYFAVPLVEPQTEPERENAELRARIARAVAALTE